MASVLRALAVHRDHAGRALNAMLRHDRPDRLASSIRLPAWSWAYHTYLLKNGHVTGVTVALMLLDGVPPRSRRLDDSVDAQRPVTGRRVQEVASDVSTDVRTSHYRR